MVDCPLAVMLRKCMKYEGEFHYYDTEYFQVISTVSEIS